MIVNTRKARVLKRKMNKELSIYYAYYFTVMLLAFILTMFLLLRGGE